MKRSILLKITSLILIILMIMPTVIIAATGDRIIIPTDNSALQNRGYTVNRGGQTTNTTVYKFNVAGYANLYCLRGGAQARGTTVIDSGSIYNVMYPNEINSTGIFAYTNGNQISTEELNHRSSSLAWLIDNIYVDENGESDELKSAILANLKEILSANGCGEDVFNKLLKEPELIKTLQQYVMWYFVRNKYTTYDDVLKIGMKSDGTEYKLDDGIYCGINNIVNKDITVNDYVLFYNALKKAATDKGNANYISINSTANLKYNEPSVTILTGSKAKSGAKTAIDVENKRVGPFKIYENTKYVGDLVFTVTVNGSQVTNYSIVDETGTAVTTSELGNKPWYIKYEGLNDTEDFKVNLKIASKRIKTEAILLDTENPEHQPLVSIKKSISSASRNTTISKKGEPEEIYDLALRKFITKVNNSYVTTSREPMFDYQSEDRIEDTGTAKYIHIKNAVAVKPTDIVSYTIRVYNEGTVNGKVTEITDYLPEGLELDPNSSINTMYKWKMYKSDGVTETTNPKEATIIKTDYLNETELIAGETVGEKVRANYEERMSGEALTNDWYADVQVDCIVKTEKNTTLINVAEISKSEFKISGTYKTPENNQDKVLINNTVEKESVFNNITNFLNKTGEDLNKELIQNVLKRTTNRIVKGYATNDWPGIEDDDDFERLTVTVQKDLALRKYITSVDGQIVNNRLNSYSTYNMKNPINNADEYKYNALYTMIKNPVQVEKGTAVVYTIEIFNEGDIDGTAAEIADYLPEGLEFVEDSELNKKYNWKMYKADGTETTKVAEAKIIKTEYLANNYIESKKTTNNKTQPYTLSSQKVEVECKVKDNAKENTILTNVSEITKYKFKYTNVTGESVEEEVDKDVDSSKENFKTKYNKELSIENLTNYFGTDLQEEINGDETQYKRVLKQTSPSTKYYYYRGTEDDDDFDKIEIVKEKLFDLALRKFITEVNETEVKDRTPVFTVTNEGKYIYNHTKSPVEVQTSNIVTYTLRIYNEGEKAGYVTEIMDDIPEGLEFVQDSDINKQYGWILYRKVKEGEEVPSDKTREYNGKKYVITEDVKQADYILTNYLSEKNGEAMMSKIAPEDRTTNPNLLKSFNIDKMEQPDFRDVKVQFKVIEPTTSDRIIINYAQITDDSDESGNPVTDIDSTPNEWNDGEDDQDIEKIKVKYFDLALLKWVSKAIVIENGKETITQTGHTGLENPEPVVKVDLQKSKIKNVVVKFEYQIKVTNEGEIAGEVREISDYIPEGLKFVAAENPKWVETDGKVTTNQLTGTVLQPGQSATVTIVLTWINREDNMGVKTNIAEISKDYNDSDTPDIDSIPNNKVPGEDDIDDAPVMLTVRTGENVLTSYVVLGLSVTSIITLGVVLIRKYVL